MLPLLLQILNIVSEIRKLESSAEVVGHFTSLRESIAAVSQAFHSDAEDLNLAKPEEGASMGDDQQRMQISSQIKNLIDCTGKAFTKLDSLLNIPHGRSPHWHDEIKKRWEVSH